MNLTLDNASEINMKTGDKKDVGRILLEGDCITLIQKL